VGGFDPRSIRSVSGFHQTLQNPLATSVIISRKQSFSWLYCAFPTDASVRSNRPSLRLGLPQISEHGNPRRRPAAPRGGAAPPGAPPRVVGGPGAGRAEEAARRPERPRRRAPLRRGEAAPPPPRLQRSGLRRRRRLRRHRAQELHERAVLWGDRRRLAAAEVHRHLRHRQFQPLGAVLQVLLLGASWFLPLPGRGFPFSGLGCVLC
jgi:hypothetical protein